ncbi:MAG: SAM-dependent methyltransferase [Eubacteriales bacterium]|nr:SAM-dependent methyltransferase [Eubacteriales bacterium]
MNRLVEEIKQYLGENLSGITISNPRKAEEIKKYNIRPVLLKGELYFQIAGYTKTQVFHENKKKEEMESWLTSVLPAYKQVQLRSGSFELNALLNKKGVATIKKKGALSIAAPDPLRLSHNREKRYILKEGTVVPFLKELGVMTAEGKIVRTRYDKFRQINRFLEFIEDVLPYLPKDREVTILDFGCGKSYLTFAMYYYLKVLKDYPIRIIGLDLKKDVIRKCSKLAESYGYDKLSFQEGSIEEFEGVDQVDMVVTLHACDTATDYAMEKAIRWGAKIILSVPCCQHELNGQLSNDNMAPIADFGILKERFSALATDGIRAKLLDAVGYDAQILEFIDMEHTPKNLLVRAVRRGSGSMEKLQAVKDFCQIYHFQPTLLRLIEENQWIKEESETSHKEEQG